MKQKYLDMLEQFSFYLILLFLATMAALVEPEPKHTCIDKTHKTCDGRCECDGMDCKVN